jgi:hypothetical protein
VIDRQRHVRGRGFADRLAVVDRLDEGQRVEVGLEAIGDLVQNDRAVRGRRDRPALLGSVRFEASCWVSLDEPSRESYSWLLRPLTALERVCAVRPPSRHRDTDRRRAAP